MWPNGTEVSRYTDKDMVLCGYEIPAGTHVDLNPMVKFRDAQIFPDPDLYIPERWLRDFGDEEGVSCGTDEQLNLNKGMLTLKDRFG